jgi:hypothetical protein
MVDEYLKIWKGTPQFVSKNLSQYNIFFSSSKDGINEEILPDVKRCLILSTLVFSDCITSIDSGRKIQHLRLTEELNFQEILEKWILNNCFFNGLET